MTPWRNVDEDHFLKGKFFLSYVSMGIGWQGKVLSVDYVSKEKPLIASCQLYSWFDGSPTCIVLLDVSEMISSHIGRISFKFFNTEEEWHAASEKESVLEEIDDEKEAL